MSPDIDTLRKQLQQLQELHSGGAIDDEQYQQSKARLERRIVDAVVQQPAAGAAPSGTNTPAATGAPGGPPVAAAAATSPAAAATPSHAGAAPSAAKAASPASAASPAKAPRAAAPDDTGIPMQPPSRRLVAGVSAFVLVLAAAGYAWKGTPAELGQGSLARAGSGAGDHAEGAPHDTGTAQVAAMVDQLAQRMKERPDDAQGWVMLARSYTVLERYADAAPAYAQALKLVGDDASLLADYADVLGMTNNRVLGPDAQQVIDRALKADANNLKALSLAGSAAFTSGNYARAVQHWERLVEVAPAESPFLPDVRSGIAEARERGKLGQGPVASQAAAAVTAATTAAAPDRTPAQLAQAAPAKPSPHDPPAAAGGNASVSGTVTLAKSLAAQASPNDTVFIFARAAEGPRMPLAILRMQVKDLPIQFKLDDSHAMAPAFKLSSFPKVVVGARISKSGEAMPQKGDLTGITAPVATGSTGLKVEINQAVSP
jgi:cytochrome c-type biogenesis protein CcmH